MSLVSTPERTKDIISKVNAIKDPFNLILRCSEVTLVLFTSHLVNQLESSNMEKKSKYRGWIFEDPLAVQICYRVRGLPNEDVRVTFRNFVGSPIHHGGDLDSPHSPGGK